MLRRRLLTSLLALLLLLTLQGEAVHALSHLEEALGSHRADTGETKKHGALHEVCSLCLSFAAMGATLPGSARAEPPTTQAACAIAATPSSRLPQTAPRAYLSRAPPRVPA